MGTRKLAALFAVAALAVTLVGAGVSATFTDQATGHQDILVGAMNVTLGSTTPGASVSSDGTTLTCPVLHVQKSSEMSPSFACDVTIFNSGSIPPSSVVLKASVTTSGADLSRFYLYAEPGTGTWDGPFAWGWATQLNSLGTGTLLGSTTALPASATTMLYWSDLTNNDFNQWVTVTYTIEATA